MRPLHVICSRNLQLLAALLCNSVLPNGIQGQAEQRPLTILVADGSYESKPDSVVLIDFSRVQSPIPFGNGFILGTAALGVSARMDSLLTGLAPTYWRVGTSEQVALVVARTSARVDLTISGAYRETHPRSGESPIDDSGKFEHWLRAFIGGIAIQPTYWEPWNEPNLQSYWRGSELQSNQLYCAVDKELRSVLGNSVAMVGPTLSHFDSLRFRRFANYVKRSGCKIHAFSWHELSPNTTPAEIVKHVRWVRDSIINNPAYSDLGISEIHLNETIPKRQRYSPGDLVALLVAARNANVDMLARSCWPEHTSGRLGCLDKSLDGVIDPATQSPRSPWWVYAAFASLRLAPVYATAPVGIYVLAGRSNPRAPALALIGRAKGRTDGDSITIVVQGARVASGRELAPGSALDLVVRRVPWAGIDAPVNHLPIIKRVRFSTNGDISIRIAIPHETILFPLTFDPLTGSDAILLSVEPESVTPSDEFWPVWVPGRLH